MRIFAVPAGALAALVLALAVGAGAAVARDQYVVDNANLFSPAAVSATNARIADFASQTGKEVFVYTTPSLDGTDVDAAAERVYAQQQVNGVMIFISKSPKKIGVYVDRASRTFFPAGSTTAIRDAIAANFNAGNFDAGLQNGVSLSMNMYRSHVPAARNGALAPVPVQRPAPVTRGGFSMGWIFLFLIIAVGFLVVRAVIRALFAPRVTGPVSGGYGPAAGAGPMPGPGYGPGYGYGGYGPGWGGGGGFWSGLLGGLGGAWLGNELFGQHNMGGNIGSAGFGGPGTDQGAGFGGAPDASGFQSDPGQIDLGNSASGDWGGGGDSGGWGASGGGFGDMGGGGGDFGGGGGW
jgi:uncharacterized membrane protein YgcG